MLWEVGAAGYNSNGGARALYRIDRLMVSEPYDHEVAINDDIDIAP